MTTLQFDELLIEVNSSTTSSDGHINEPGDFHFPLPLRYDLGDEHQYEVALCDFTYTVSWYNLESDAAIVWGFDSKNFYTANIPAGHYSDIHYLLEIVNAAIHTSKPDKITRSSPKFVYNPGRNEVEFVEEESTSPFILTKPFITLPEILKRKLGYYSETDHRSCNISNGLHALYIHLDIIHPQIIGNRMEPVLQIIHLPHRPVYGTVEKESFAIRKYFPLRLNEFQMLKFSVKDSHGNVVNFKYGTVKLWLHFRRS